MRILVGTNNLKSGGKYYAIDNVIEHEKYFDPPLAYDIAVVRVTESIEFSEKVQPIKLSTTEVPDGVDLVVTRFKLFESSYLEYSCRAKD